MIFLTSRPQNMWSFLFPIKNEQKRSKKMNKQKIAFCIPDMIVGGVETVFISTLEELLKYPDLKISVYMQSKLQEKYYQDWFNHHPEIKLKVIYPMLPYFENLKKRTNFFPLKNLRKLIFSLYKMYRRSIFHINNHDIYIDYKNASFFKELRHIKTPKITWCHGSFDFFQKSKLINRLKYYDKMVVLTDEFKDEFTLHYPSHSSKIIRIYNPITPEHIITKAKTGPTYPGRYFCSISRLGSPKDIHTIIDAFTIFLRTENTTDIKLLIIGDGPNRTGLEQHANQSTAKEHIIFLGTQTNPFGYMQKSMAHILSSHSEGFGMVLLESASVGTLNISTQHKNGAQEILLNGTAGLLFNIGDKHALSQIMSNIYHNRIPRQKIIKNSQLSLNRFNPKKITAEILELINSL